MTGMRDFEIDFDQPVGEYEFKPASADRIQKYRSGSDDALSQALEISEEDLPWLLGSLVRKSVGKRVRPTAKQMEQAIDLLVRCQWSRLPTVAVRIARYMGGLVNKEAEPMTFWYMAASGLREMFSNPTWMRYGSDGSPIWPDDPPGAQRAGLVGVYLLPDKSGGRKLALRPHSLDGALTLCAARMIASGTTFNTCEHCKAPFLGGGAGRGRNKKRADARFCSDACRWGYHNASRRKTRSQIPNPDRRQQWRKSKSVSG
jgi:hypothetical protein